MIIIADSGPLIALSKIDLLDIIHKLYGEIFIPDEVYKELVILGKGRAGSEQIKKAKWIKKKSVKDKGAISLLRAELGEGESGVLVLAEELKANFVIIDELPARRNLEAMNIPKTGTLGILLEAKEEKLIDKIKPLLDRLIEEKFRISKELYEAVLRVAGEL